MQRNHLRVVLGAMADKNPPVHEHLPGLFASVGRLCQRTGLAKLGHIAIDGTKVRASANKHKAMRE